MRGRRVIGGLGGSALIAAIALVVALPAGGNVALAPPAPCTPGVVINDSATDGHHQPTDVLSAWLSEESGGNLQAVIVVDLGNWDAEHVEPEVVAGYVFLFTKGGVTRFVRLSVDEDFIPTYDYGTYTFPNTFTSEGPTIGSIDPLPIPAPPASDGTAVIDVPTTVADNGDLLTDTYVLTYDGIINGPPNPPTWVDHAPGGEAPVDEDTDPRGPDYLFGSCTAVAINAPGSIKGGKTVTISGSVLPAADDTPVAITREGLNTVVTNTATDALGNYSVQVPVKETTKIRAEADGISSQTRTITVRSTVTIKAIRLANGKTRIKGVTSPWLPGRVLLLKTTAFTPAMRKQIQGGAFSFTPRRLSPGRWQVVYIPAGNRAVRSTSPAVRVR